MATISPAVSSPLVTLGDVLAIVAGIPPARIRLLPTPGTGTEVDVVRVRQEERKLCELMNGVLVEKAMRTRESMIACQLIMTLGSFIKQHDLGVIVGEGGMLRLGPGLIRIPDVSFISWPQFPGRRLPAEPVWGVHPDLAIEVLSETNTEAEMTRKLREYFASGTRLVWIVDPRTETVTVYPSLVPATEAGRLGRGELLQGAEVLPGFTLAVDAVFDL